jgi:hypothetical protein
MQDIRASLKMYGKIVSLLKDVITDRVALTTHLGIQQQHKT